MEPLRIIFGQLREMAFQAIQLLPQMVVAILLLLLTWAVSRAVKTIYQRTLSRSRMRPSLVDVLRRLIGIFIWICGIMVAATVLFPTLTPGNLLAGLGIGSLAIGLAFKDIFENFLAGILIMLREPMRLNDFIECEGVEGRVEKITIRDCYIRRTDGELVLVPNAMLFKNPVYVVTDRDQRRTTIICGVAYGEDVDAARAVIQQAVGGLDSVAKDRPIQIFAKGFGDSSIDFEVTWWTGSQPVDIRRSRDQVVAAVKRALDDAGIEIPFPYRTLTFKGAVPVETAGISASADEAVEQRGEVADRPAPAAPRA